MVEGIGNVEGVVGIHRYVFGYEPGVFSRLAVAGGVERPIARGGGDGRRDRLRTTLLAVAEPQRFPFGVVLVQDVRGVPAHALAAVIPGGHLALTNLPEVISLLILSAS